MSKEVLRMLFLQVAALVGIFGWASPRLMAAAQILQHLANEHWDEIWALVSGSQKTGVKAEFAKLSGLVGKSIKGPAGNDDPYAFCDNAKP